MKKAFCAPLILILMSSASWAFQKKLEGSTRGQDDGPHLVIKLLGIGSIAMIEGRDTTFTGDQIAATPFFDERLSPFLHQSLGASRKEVALAMGFVRSMNWRLDWGPPPSRCFGPLVLNPDDEIFTCQGYGEIVIYYQAMIGLTIEEICNYLADHITRELQVARSVSRSRLQ